MEHTVIDTLNMLKGRVQLRAMKSLETGRGVAWTANVYLDGKKVGDVENKGDGGATRINLPADALEVLHADAAQYSDNARYREQAFDPKKAHVLDYYLGELADAVATRKRMMGRARSKVLLVMPNTQPGQYHLIDVKPTPEHIAEVEKANVGCTVLNGLL